MTGRDIDVVPAKDAELTAVCIWVDPGKRVILDPLEARAVYARLGDVLEEEEVDG